MVGPAEVPAGDRRVARAVLLGVGEVPASRRRGHGARRPDVPARGPGGLRVAARRAGPRRHRHAVRLRSRSPGHRAGGRSRRRSKRFASSCAREGTCLVLGPHHEVGQSRRTGRSATSSTVTTATRSCPDSNGSADTRDRLMKGLGIPVENRWGLRPPSSTGRPDRAADDRWRTSTTRGWLAGVRNFNFHMHLPHYALTTEDTRLHPRPGPTADRSVQAASLHGGGEQEFNALVWMPPGGRQGRRRAGRRLHRVQHVVRQRREPGAFLEEPRHGE